MEKLDQFIKVLKETAECIVNEQSKIKAGQISKWTIDQLDGIVSPEINGLLSYALKGKVFFKYGKEQRLLESSYLMSDSLENLGDTSLGKKIIKLQDIYDSL